MIKLYRKFFLYNHEKSAIEVLEFRTMLKVNTSEISKSHILMYYF